MTRRKSPARPKGQQRHRTKPTVQQAPAPTPIEDSSGRPEQEYEYFVVAGKRYRWMTSEGGKRTAVPAPMPPRLIRKGSGLRFQDRAGNVTELNADIVPSVVDLEGFGPDKRLIEGLILEKRDEVRRALERVERATRNAVTE